MIDLAKHKVLKSHDDLIIQVDPVVYETEKYFAFSLFQNEYLIGYLEGYRSDQRMFVEGHKLDYVMFEDRKLYLLDIIPNVIAIDKDKLILADNKAMVLYSLTTVLVPLSPCSEPLYTVVITSK